MRAFQVFAVLAAVAAADAEQGSLRKQPCDKDCRIKHAQGKVDDAEEALDKNMESSQANRKMIAYTKSIKGNSDIASQEKAIAAETQTSALGKMLGSMWREMREYQGPMYEEKLGAQSSKLADDHAGLQAKLALARDELDAATAKESAQEKVDDDEEAPPAKLVIKKPRGKSVEMHSKDDDDEKDDDEKDDDEKDDDDDDDKEDDDEKVSVGPCGAVKEEGKPCAEEDAEAVAEEAEQEVDKAKAKKEAPAPNKEGPAPNHKPWSNNGLAKGMAATADQHAQLWKHGLRAGDPGRKGMYPVDLTAPPAKLVIEKPHGKSVEMHSEEDDEKDDENDEEDNDDKKVSTEPVKAEAKPCADEDAEAVAEEAEQEAEPAPSHKPWSNNGLAKGVSATADQHAQLWKHGLSAGDPGRKGMYPVDLSAPAASRPQWSIDAEALIPRFAHAGDPFGKKTVVEAPPEDAAAAAAKDPAAAAAKDPAAVVEVATDPAAAEAAGEDEEADPTKDDGKKLKVIVRANSEDSTEDDDGDDAEDEEAKAPTKAAAGLGDGVSATHHQFKKFMSGGFFNGDARQGLYPTDLTK